MPGETTLDHLAVYPAFPTIEIRDRTAVAIVICLNDLDISTQHLSQAVARLRSERLRDLRRVDVCKTNRTAVVELHRVTIMHGDDED